MSHRYSRTLSNCKLVLVLLLLIAGLWSSFSAYAAEVPEREVTAFLVTGYAYEAGPSGDVPKIARSLCATRCNAFSSDYLNYTEAGGWRMTRVATSEKIRVELNNPFLDGNCLCTADRYKVVVNELSYPDRSVLGEIKNP